jgi:hypothetical protein
MAAVAVAHLIASLMDAPTDPYHSDSFGDHELEGEFGEGFSVS